ncbi:hypothetical protein TRIUR3_34815 [Triticum urartu]|uniref:Uncharacterized protein n=1 Tax=Triticum urartu TaxID=4572 RepID=M8AQM5_TRIUA|nr:hypothetical protein TRIUR3_34815 [Triticum urartu]
MSGKAPLGEEVKEEELVGNYGAADAPGLGEGTALEVAENVEEHGAREADGIAVAIARVHLAG